ncbi:hypothetical protein [Nakamurella leprariae]|uniref:Uncharacterized protein n=1 Tax=Nakamurella leprariae TaxID=2803911 RepID=A0A938YEJ5_9ACTN|nr:hypothetical protein [Nakamurella leprariae]MBM9466739.1 hypothetical protein [Nakamurella leprariae]
MDGQWSLGQDIINQIGPPGEKPKGTVGAIPVVARLVFADGRQQWWPAQAVRWTRSAVLVAIRPPTGQLRASPWYLWLSAVDVTRVLQVTGGGVAPGVVPG